MAFISLLRKVLEQSFYDSHIRPGLQALIHFHHEDTEMIIEPVRHCIHDRNTVMIDLLKMLQNALH